ncbi:hypothetical protein JG687_00017967 [Phytophthora cactorum]|uniref:Ubiquitin-like protease family profile domain-containing protein n=1 Tax=Phytophthora cactorum TaxID=29920 RepID=A0A8T1TNP5_9STRA|nr:hypothetical protein JG687_00017967 [Phytophthora cactorum]
MSVPFLVAQQMDSSSKVKEISLVLTKILIPLCCHKNHWCRIVVDAQLKDACVYDLMFSSYNVSVRSIEEKLATKQPDYAPRKYCEHHYQGDLGVQVDSYNCGIVRPALV